MVAIFDIYIALGDTAATGDAHNIIKLIGDQHLQFHVTGIMQGVWMEESPEDTLVVQIADHESAINSTILVLKKYLGHELVVAENIQDKFQ